MDLSNTATLPSLIAIIGYALILLTAFLRRGRQEKQVHYLLAFLLSSILWQFSLILLPDDLYPPHMDMVVLLLGTAILGMTTAVYAASRLFTDAFRQNSWFTADGYRIIQIISLAIMLACLYALNHQIEKIKKIER